MNGKIEHTNKRMKRPQGRLQTQRGGMRLHFHVCMGRKAGRRGGGEAGARWGGCGYLQCWCCCCCICFAGYQHGLVSMLCVWLHPESRKGRGKRDNKKEKKTNEKGRKEMSKQRMKPPECAARGGTRGSHWPSTPPRTAQRWGGRRRASLVSGVLRKSDVPRQTCIYPLPSTRLLAEGQTLAFGLWSRS